MKKLFVCAIIMLITFSGYANSICAEEIEITKYEAKVIDRKTGRETLFNWYFFSPHLDMKNLNTPSKEMQILRDYKSLLVNLMNDEITPEEYLIKYNNVAKKVYPDHVKKKFDLEWAERLADRYQSDKYKEEFRSTDSKISNIAILSEVTIVNSVITRPSSANKDELITSAGVNTFHRDESGEVMVYASSYNEHSRDVEVATRDIDTSELEDSSNNQGYNYSKNSFLDLYILDVEKGAAKTFGFEIIND